MVAQKFCVVHWFDKFADGGLSIFQLLLVLVFAAQLPLPDIKEVSGKTAAGYVAFAVVETGFAAVCLFERVANACASVHWSYLRLYCAFAGWKFVWLGLSMHSIIDRSSLNWQVPHK